MGTKKTATAGALIEPEIKEQAEAILKELGLTVSTVFGLFYRQIRVVEKIKATKIGFRFRLDMAGLIAENPRIILAGT